MENMIAKRDFPPLSKQLDLMKIKVLCFITVREFNFHFVILMYQYFESTK